MDLSKASSGWPEAELLFCVDLSYLPRVPVLRRVLDPWVSWSLCGLGCGVCHPGKTLFCTELQPDLKGTGCLIVTLENSP